MPNYLADPETPTAQEETDQSRIIYVYLHFVIKFEKKKEKRDKTIIQTHKRTFLRFS